MQHARQQQIHDIAEQLAAAGVASPLWDAKQLVAHVLPDNGTATAQDIARLNTLVEQRVQRVPLQLLVGDTGFRFLMLLCRPGVFIPRPETEILVDLILRETADIAAPRIIEPCTGTGAISASLIAESSTVSVRATDTNPSAVALARQNIARVVAGEAGVPPRPPTVSATVYEGSLFEPLPQDWYGQTDAIVCNPPYLPDAVHDALPVEVRDHDPYDAVVGGSDGHELVGDVLAEAAAWLRPGGLVLVEVDVTRGDDACARARHAGLTAITFETDLTGARRFVTARRNT